VIQSVAAKMNKTFENSEPFIHTQRVHVVLIQVV